MVDAKQVVVVSTVKFPVDVVQHTVPVVAALLDANPGIVIPPLSLIPKIAVENALFKTWNIPLATRRYFFGVAPPLIKTMVDPLVLLISLNVSKFMVPVPVKLPIILRALPVAEFAPLIIDGNAVTSLIVTAVPIDGVKIQFPVIVGEILWDKAGAPSLRIHVVAVPLIADNPNDAVGFAPLSAEFAAGNTPVINGEPAPTLTFCEVALPESAPPGEK